MWWSSAIHLSSGICNFFVSSTSRVVSHFHRNMSRVEGLSSCQSHLFFVSLFIHSTKQGRILIPSPVAISANVKTSRYPRTLLIDVLTVGTISCCCNNISISALSLFRSGFILGEKWCDKSILCSQINFHKTVNQVELVNVTWSSNNSWKKGLKLPISSWWCSRLVWSN